MTDDSTKKQAAGTPAPPRQVLTFQLGAETFGVDILRVKEIRGWSPVTRIPNSPADVLGVLNLRGSIVPVMNLRMRLGLETIEFTALTVIIVLSVVTRRGRRNEFGMVVDSVADVVDIGANDLKDAPNLGGNVDANFVECLATVAGRMLILLDVDALIGKDFEQDEAVPLAGAA